MQAAAVAPCRVAVVVGQGVNGDMVIFLLERRIKRLHDALWLCRAEAKLVLSDMQDTALRERRSFGAAAFAGRFDIRLALDRLFAVHARITLLIEKAANLVFREIGGHGDGERDDEPRVAELG